MLVNEIWRIIGLSKLILAQGVLGMVGTKFIFICPSGDGTYYVIGYSERGGGRADVQTGFRTISLVLYIGSLPNFAT